MQQANGNQFYVNRALETVLDPLGPPVVQNQLLDELRKCDHLVQLDWRYAQMVAGASKMPMNMVWVARNQDEPVSDTDLAALKDLAWNEIVKKRYLASIPGTSTVSDTAASMLEIVREMNLQRRRFQIMGLHEQVEASEIHLVLHLCQAGLLRTDRYRVAANRFRRHDKLFEAFGLAVGAFVCASAPFTLGAATTRYERDLQYEYKKNATALFVYVLQQNMGGMNAVELEEDYVARIARLIVVWPDEGTGGDRRRIGFKPPSKGGKKGDDDDDDDDGGGGGRGFGNAVLSSVAVAQDVADKAKSNVERLRGEFEVLQVRCAESIHSGKSDIEKVLAETLATNREHFTTEVRRTTDDLRAMVETKIGRLDQELGRQRSAVEVLDTMVKTRPIGPGDQESMSLSEHLKLNQTNDMVRGLEGRVGALEAGLTSALSTIKDTSEITDGKINSIEGKFTSLAADCESKTNDIPNQIEAKAIQIQNSILGTLKVSFGNEWWTVFETRQDEIVQLILGVGNVAEYRNFINALPDRVTVIEGGMAALNTNLSTNTESIQTHGVEIARFTQDQTAQLSRMGAFVDGLHNTVTDLSQKNVTSNQALSTLQESLRKALETIETHTTKISSLENEKDLLFHALESGGSDESQMKDTSAADTQANSHAIMLKDFSNWKNSVNARIETFNHYMQGEDLDARLEALEEERENQIAFWEQTSQASIRNLVVSILNEFEDPDLDTGGSSQVGPRPSTAPSTGRETDGVNATSKKRRAPEEAPNSASRPAASPHIPLAYIQKTALEAVQKYLKEQNIETRMRQIAMEILQIKCESDGDAPMLPGHPAAASDPSGFEARLRTLERLFITMYTPDETPFTPAPPPPGTGNFQPPALPPPP